ncbi:MAG TPA: hypothetical protein VK110_00135 [Salinisphaeraceae bacterium]|nr:hypothetical protein [Salinisphaeraceae bacterium]
MYDHATSIDARYHAAHLLRATRLFLVVGLAAILAGGLLAAVTAHDPVRPLIWLSAYLVLIVGLAQCVFGVGQTALRARPPGTVLVGSQWLLFNLGNLGVVIGSLGNYLMLLTVGTVLFFAALALFALSVRQSQYQRLGYAYYAVLAIVAAGAVIGLGLSALGNAGQ